MVKLRRMSEDEYQQFIAWAVKDYAEAQVKAGAWLVEQAQAMAQHAFNTRLPDGLDTPDQWLLMIEREADGAKVGQLWWGRQQQGEQQFAALNDFHIFPSFRRQGLGAKAIAAMEAEIRAKGLDTVYLHVFGHNEPARALYRKLGYIERNVTMMKGL